MNISIRRRLERLESKMAEPIMAGDLMDLGEKHDAIMDELFEHDPRSRTLTLGIDYEYEVDLDRIGDKEALLMWVWHLSEKTWMTAGFIHEFIRRVYRIKAWTRIEC